MVKYGFRLLLLKLIKIDRVLIVWESKQDMQLEILVFDMLEFLYHEISKSTMLDAPNTLLGVS